MSKLSITDYSFYKWRYPIGYGLLGIGLIAVLTLVCLYSPGGISQQETQSVIVSDSVSVANIGSLAIPNLPYHMLQKVSLMLFGVSLISIKLASIVLALLSSIGIIILLRRWFSPNVGILASLIAITTSQFLFIAQDGTPGILYLFWSVWLLLLASLIARKTKFRAYYKIAFFITAALSLYTPLSIYVLIAMGVAIILHPHLRYLIKQLSQLKMAIGAGIAIILMIPLIITMYKTPSFGLELFGIPTSWPNWGNNLASLSAQYLGFSNPGSSTLLTPFFGLGSSLIILLGVYGIVKKRSTAKSYAIAIWMILLLPAVILNPSYISITFLPLVLLMALGLDTLLGYWYGLFPRNPYARVAGLVPLVVLVSVLVVSGLARNIYGYQYDPDIVANFSKDISLLPGDTKTLVVSNDQYDFYRIIADGNKQLTVMTAPNSTDSFAATREAKNDFKGYQIDKIITTYTSNNADRFYLYKKINK
ncbi:MAG: glycosyltransferase family 39 protein [Candidatus Saccharimonadales bacterium]